VSSCSLQPLLETRILCEIQSDLAGADERKFVEKNKRFWSIGKHYLKVEYQVRVIIGPADIRFELCEYTCQHPGPHLYKKIMGLTACLGFDGQKLSKDAPIRVEWTPAPAPPPQPVSPRVYGDEVLVMQNSNMSVQNGWQNGNTSPKTNSRFPGYY